MNKTININLGGLFFHIDEEAYKVLRRYLDSIASALSDDPQGKNEIINDIELRISELLSERITDPRQVVSVADIEEVVAIMGKPEDYDLGGEFEETAYYNTKKARKLYRDGDDKFLGGVCSGLGHYLNIDPLWIRLFFLVLVFAGFGSGFLIYILLWILVPEAKTTTEKLQMEGAQVNISNIEKRVKKEYQEIEKKVKDGDYVNKAKDGSQRFFSSLGKLLAGMFKVIGKGFGVLFIIIGISALFGIIVGLFSVGSLGILDAANPMMDLPSFFYSSALPFWAIIISAMVLTAIPFLLILILGFRILSGRNPMGKTTGLVFLGIWLIALFMVIYSTLDMVSHRSTRGWHTDEIELEISKNDTINVSMISGIDLIGYDDLNYRRNKEVYLEDIGLFYNNDVDLDIKKTREDKAFIQIQKRAMGADFSDAKDKAEALKYELEISENRLLLDGFFLGVKENFLNDCAIDVTIYLPEESFIYLDPSTSRFLNDVANVDDIYDRDMPDHIYHMSPNGLKCIDCQLDKLNNL